jgi:hypothetical protein
MKRLVIADARVFNFDEADYCRSTDQFRRMYPTLYPATSEITLLPHYDECWFDYERGPGSFGGDIMALVDEIADFASKGYLLPIDTFVIHTSDTIERDRMYDSLKQWYNVIRAR